MSALDDETTATGPEAPAPQPTEPPDRFKQQIAISLAILVVLGAGLAIVQVQASSNESNTARDTTRVAVRAMRANVVADTVAGLAPQIAAERAFLPFEAPLTSGVSSLTEAAGIPTGGAGTAIDLRHAQRSVPDLGVEKLLPALQTDAERLTLQQRALATTRITWNDRSTQYTTVIAVLAVSIFLVGFGLVVGGPIRRAAYLLGVTVGALAAAWALWIYFLPIPSTPEPAIRATARGTVLSEHARYRAALVQYDRAIRAAGDYAPAYSGRASARLLAANPDYPVTRAITRLGGRSLAEALEDARKALRFDSRDILATSLLALTSFYAGDYAQASGATEAALGIHPGVPSLWLLKGATEVGVGDRKAAGASLVHGLRLLRGATPSAQTRLLAATYLSYMAWLEHNDPVHAAAARGLANRVVSIETAFTLGRSLSNHAPARGRVSVTRLRYRHGELALRLRWTGLPAGTALTAIGYERPLPDGAWSQPPSLALFATVAGDGQRNIRVALPRVCKPTSVRADVYLNGVPALSRTGPGVHATC